jgi:hypothetical protein
LKGDYKTGASYWAGQRSLPHPGSCRQLSDDFYAGCTEAKVKLSSSDALRQTEPEYKAGWNAWTPSETGATRSPQAETQKRRAQGHRILKVPAPPYIPGP